MKTPVLLCVDGPAEQFASLFAAAKAAGLRFGWLVLNAPVDPPPPLQAPPLLEAFRAVAVGDGRSIAMKPMKGKAVLRDLLREHFLGADVDQIAREGRLGDLDAVGGEQAEELALGANRLTAEDLNDALLAGPA